MCVCEGVREEVSRPLHSLLHIKAQRLVDPLRIHPATPGRLFHQSTEIARGVLHGCMQWQGGVQWAQGGLRVGSRAQGGVQGSGWGPEQQLVLLHNLSAYTYALPA